MTTHEERAELMRIAKELTEELRSTTKRVHLVINKLVGAADALALEAADERSAGEHVTKASPYAPRFDLPPGAVANVTVPKIAAPPYMQKIVAGMDAHEAKRKCSVCREPGHRAQNCPNAHKVQAAKKAAVDARPVKKVRGPVSPERRAQLAANLAKARAARKNGGPK